jgi:hypothetical protein
VRALVAGHVAAAAADYAAAGVELGFLRIVGFDPQCATRPEVEAYLRAVDSFTGAGVATVADAVGRFGLVAAAAGAAGFSCGARHHKFVGEDVIVDAEEMTSDPMFYEVPHRWFELDHAQARSDAQHGLLPGCPEGLCGALTEQAGSADLKEHMIHYFTHEVRAMAEVGAAGTQKQLASHPRGANPAWAAAL